VSLLEKTISENSKFQSLKLDLQNSKLVLLVLVQVSWFYGFLVLVKTRASISREFIHSKGSLKLPNDALGKCTLPKVVFGLKFVFSKNP
jgi:hypothetical protein